MENAANTIESAKTWLDYAEQLGPTFVAIVAIIVTFLIAKHQIKGTFLTAQHQIKATAITVSRRQRVDLLRDDLAKIIGLHLKENILKKFDSTNIHEFQNIIAELSTMQCRIELLLNPSDTSHSVLIQALCDLRDSFHETGNNRIEKVQTAVDEVITTGRKVINEEWSKIKSGQ